MRAGSQLTISTDLFLSHVSYYLFLFTSYWVYKFQ